MPTSQSRDTDYPYERYVDGVLQVSLDGHNWQIHIPTSYRHEIYRTASRIMAPHFDAWAQSVLNQIREMVGVTEPETKETDLSPFQQWEKGINE